MHSRLPFALGILAGASATIAAIALGAGAGADEPPHADDDGADVLRVRRIEIVDEIGTAQLVLGANRDGGTISVRDRFGKTLIAIGASEHGGAIVLNNAAATAPAVMAGAIAGGGAVQVFDASGARVFDALAGEHGGQVTLGSRGDSTGATGAPGAPGAVGGAAGRSVVRLEALAHGTAALSLASPKGGKLFSIYPDAGGNGVVETYHGESGRSLVTLSSTIGGHGQLRTFGTSGQPLVALTAAAGDEGHIYTYDGSGRPLVAIASRPAGPSVRLYGRSGEPAVTVETDDEGRGLVGVYKPDGEGRALTP